MMSYRSWETEQLFVALGGKASDSLVSKQCISTWLVELIEFVYCQADLPVLQGNKCHETKKQDTSLADLAGVDPKQTCDAAT